MALGNKTEANRLIELAMEDISTMPITPYKDFIMGTYKTIKRP